MDHAHRAAPHHRDGGIQALMASPGCLVTHNESSLQLGGLRTAALQRRQVAVFPRLDQFDPLFDGALLAATPARRTALAAFPAPRTGYVPCFTQKCIKIVSEMCKN